MSNSWKQSVDSLDELPKYSFFVPRRTDPFDTLDNANMTFVVSGLLQSLSPAAASARFLRSGRQ
jgi:hypothetical protein